MNEWSHPYVCPSKPILWLMIKQLSKRFPRHAFATNGKLREYKERGLYDHHSMSERIQFMIAQENRKMSVGRAFPSCPGHPGKYEVKTTRDDGAVNVMVFFGVFAAKKFVDAMIDGRDWGWITRKKLQCHDLTISSPYLERIITHEYTSDEQAWILPLPYNYYARAIAYSETYSGASEAVNSQANKDMHSSKRRKSRQTSTDPDAKSTSKSSKSTSDDETQPKRAFSKGRTTFGPQEIASHFGMKPNKVRTILRAHVTKPAGGWEWPISEFEEISKIVSKNR
jgi:hypothetical protein